MSETTPIRYLVAFVLLVYGFAKINGSQFTILDSELDKPMGEVSGFWLTWYYFGYSQVYGMFIAALQVGGALLLTFQRTALLGACILLPVLANIILIDICYGVDPSATVVALLLLAGTIAVIAQRWTELTALFWPTRGRTGVSVLKVSATWAMRFAMVAVALGFTWWVANYNNRLPTSLDGAWDVVDVAPRSTTARFPEAIFFEHNRAYMVVFRTGRGRYDTHHFEIDASGSASGCGRNGFGKDRRSSLGFTRWQVLI